MGSSLATVRKHLDTVSAAVSALATTPVIPEPAPTYDDCKKLFPALRFTSDDTTGFDEPIRTKAPGYNIRRTMSTDSPQIRILRDLATPSMTINVQHDGGNGTHGEVLWFDEPYYADWLAYGRKEWTGERAIDCRHLTNQELELLVTVIDAYAMCKQAGTWLSWHYRVTLEQMQYVVARKSEPKEDELFKPAGTVGHMFPFYLYIPQWGAAPFKGKLADAARSYIDIDLLSKGRRILTMLDGLKLRIG